MEEKKKERTRYVGIDLGKRTYTVAIVGSRGSVTMSNGRTSVDGRQSLYRKLRPGDKVALEAGNMAFMMAKEIEEAAGCRVFVLNASHLPLIYGTMKKTDKEDALKLAHILEDFREERLPIVPVPSEKDIQRRKIVASNRQEVQSRTRAINRLHGLFVARGITTMKKKDLANAEKRRVAILRLEGHEREEAEHLLACLELYEQRLEALEKHIEEDIAGDEQIQRLQTIPGVGPKTSFAFAAHVAAERFENASQVSNYLGLVPRVYMSGDTVKYGRITKRGNGYLRALLVQASWALVLSRNGGKLKERFYYMVNEKSKSKKKAIVAVARHLAEEMYALMRDGTEHETRPFVPEKREAVELAQLAASA